MIMVGLWIYFVVSKMSIAPFSYQASKDDITVHAALSEAPSAEFVNVSRWYNHIDSLLRIS